jgi:hypothetical protein
MRAAKVLAVLAIAALGIGSFSAVAQAGNRDPKKTTVNFANQSPSFNSGKVSANGQVVSHCGGMDGVPVSIGPVSMILQVLDTNGVVLTTLDSSTSEPDPIRNIRNPKKARRAVTPKDRWTLSGQLPTTLPAGTNYVRVKAKRQVLLPNQGDIDPRKMVCHQGFSPTVAIPAA